MASETCAFDLIEARLVREVAPGEVVELAGEEPLRAAAARVRARTRTASSSTSTSPAPTRGCSARTSARCGSGSAGSSPASTRSGADIVVAVPDSGVPAALGYARESGIPFDLGLVRNHYVGRTFIEPRQSIRHFGVKIKLNAGAQRRWRASASCWWTTPSCAAPRRARS